MAERIAIVGSRPDPAIARGLTPRDDARRLAVRDYIHGLSEQPVPPVIVSGGAKGVDAWAEEAALDCGLVVVRCIPPWERLGKCAGMVRNQVIVDIADRVVAFWDGKSKGTANTIGRARSAGKPVEVYKP